MSDSKERGIVQKSYDNLWSESNRTKSLLKFFSSKDLRDAASGAPSPDEHRPAYKPAQLIGLILGPLLFVLALLFIKSESLDSSGIFVVAAALWIATWWVTEAIPIPATSLLPLI